MTVSNLRGIPFTVTFPPSEHGYGMQTHSDRAHYIIRGLGTGKSLYNKWINEDSGRELDIAYLPRQRPTLPQEWKQYEQCKWNLYGTCALASSAFPIGLAPRQIDGEITEFRERSYPIPRGEATIKPSFPSSLSRFGSLNVDGGVINNNPFDYAQFALMGDRDAKHTSDNEANGAVIMVSPFPEPPAFLAERQPPAELVAVLRALFPALINQARFKPSEIVPALNSDDRSRFLIVPHRIIEAVEDGRKYDVEQKYKIACGLLGGFGGFLDEKFRAHDFQLGRRNCQQFLKTELRRHRK